MAVIKDLGAVSAYALAVEGGYTGTQEEFEQLMASYATVAQQAKQSAEDAEAYAIGKRDGTDVDSSDPAYHNNAAYYAGQASDSATGAASARDDAVSAKNDAADAKDLAVGAKNDAVSARDDAVSAKEAAVSAKNDAVDAKTAAETAQGKAEDAQAAAETAQGKAEDAAEELEGALEDISDLKSQLNDFVDDTFDIEEHKSLNLLDPDEVGQGYYWTDGFHTSTSYVYTGLIELEQNKHYTMQTGASGIAINRAVMTARFVVYYAGDGTTVKGYASSTSDIILPTADSKYVRCSYNYVSVSDFLATKPSFVEGTTVLDYIEYFAPYTSKILKAECNNDPHIRDIVNQTIESESGKLIFTTTSASLQANTNLICCDYSSNKKNEYIELTAYFSTFGELTISHGKGSYAGGYIKITDSEISIYNGYNNTLIEEFEHGLTISGFINVIIYTKNDSSCRSSITIMTAEGDYTIQESRFYGIRGAVLCNANFAMTDVKMQYVVNDAREDVWVFGDSYISLGDPSRWATQLILANHKHLLLNGFGGAMSENVYPVEEYFADIVTPKYIVWCLGMNDADSGAINSSWKTCVDNLLAYCEAKGITPILATIPNCPNIDNTYKNAYVKSLNVRYVDFAKAVNAENAGATWYTGMLSNDNTHPTALGAKALMRQFLIDVPEVLYAEE